MVEEAGIAEIPKLYWLIGGVALGVILAGILKPKPGKSLMAPVLGSGLAALLGCILLVHLSGMHNFYLGEKRFAANLGTALGYFLLSGIPMMVTLRILLKRKMDRAVEDQQIQDDSGTEDPPEFFDEEPGQSPQQ